MFGRIVKSLGSAGWHGATLAWLIVACLSFAPRGSATAVNSEEAAIEKGVAWLLAAQGLDGSWRNQAWKGMPTGVTALAAYTLLECGVDSDHRAIKLATAYMKSRSCEKTYPAGFSLLAYTATDDSAHDDEIERLTKLLLEFQQREGWGYPANSTGENPIYADMSNTQVALLGLRAAARQGQKVPAAVFADAAESLLRRQGRDGGFGYQRSNEPTGAMTAAGVACLEICRGALDQGRRNRSLLKKVEAARDEGLEWLSSRWTVEDNPAVPKRTKDTDRWHLYYLYGLERVGSLLDLRRIGGHAWYPEGAAEILSRQQSDGSWKEYVRAVDTCLALLFLTRASRDVVYTGIVNEPPKQPDPAALTILGEGRRPYRAWIQSAGSKVKDRLERDETIRSLTWLVSDRAVLEIATKPTDPDPLLAAALEHVFVENGEQDIILRIAFDDTHGQPAGEEVSNRLRVPINDLLTEADHDALQDLGQNLIRPNTGAVKASSQSRWTDAESVTDGSYSNQWHADVADKSPWVQIDLPKSVKATRLKLGMAGGAAARTGEFSRAKKILVSLGRGRTYELDLKDTPQRKHELVFPVASVKSVRIEIVDRHPGSKSSSVGLAEVELFREP